MIEIDLEKVRESLKKYKTKEITKDTGISKVVIYNFLNKRSNMNLESFIKILSFLRKFNKNDTI